MLEVVVALRWKKTSKGYCFIMEFCLMLEKGIINEKSLRGPIRFSRVTLIAVSSVNSLLKSNFQLYLVTENLLGKYDCKATLISWVVQ